MQKSSKHFYRYNNNSALVATNWPHICCFNIGYKKPNSLNRLECLLTCRCLFQKKIWLFCQGFFVLEFCVWMSVIRLQILRKFCSLSPPYCRCLIWMPLMEYGMQACVIFVCWWPTWTLLSKGATHVIHWRNWIL